jgi:hypothetical protein
MIADTISAIGMASDDSLGNFWQVLSPLVANQTGAANNIVAAVLLTPKLSGYIDVDINVGWSDSTAGDDVQWQLNTRQVNVAGQVFTVGGTTPAASGYGGATAGGGDSGFVQTAANGMTVSAPAGGATGPTLVETKMVATVAGLLTANGSSSQGYDFHSALDTNGTGVPFTLGKQVVAYLSVLSGGANTIEIPRMSFRLREIPWR